MEDLKVILTMIGQTELAKRLGVAKSNPAYWLKANAIPEVFLPTLAALRKDVTLEFRQEMMRAKNQPIEKPIKKKKMYVNPRLVSKGIGSGFNPASKIIKERKKP